ncbi:transcriptional regulator swi6 [Dinochytrium kinnereticum]|nr:transcriptional regulator swi6 [Dinochytrium kinnereticum]
MKTRADTPPPPEHRQYTGDSGFSSAVVPRSADVARSRSQHVYGNPIMSSIKREGRIGGHKSHTVKQEESGLCERYEAYWHVREKDSMGCSSGGTIINNRTGELTMIDLKRHLAEDQNCAYSLSGGQFMELYSSNWSSRCDARMADHEMPLRCQKSDKINQGIIKAPHSFPSRLVLRPKFNERVDDNSGKRKRKLLGRSGEKNSGTKEEDTDSDSSLRPPHKYLDLIPKVYTAMYCGVPVLETVIRRIYVMRRQSDGYMSATQILRLAGMTKLRRNYVIQKEVVTGPHELVPGTGKYQGVWIPLRAAKSLAKAYGVEEELAFFFTPNFPHAKPVAKRHEAVIRSRRAKPSKTSTSIPILIDLTDSSSKSETLPQLPESSRESLPNLTTTEEIVTPETVQPVDPEVPFSSLLAAISLSDFASFENSPASNVTIQVASLRNSPTPPNNGLPSSPPKQTSKKVLDQPNQKVTPVMITNLESPTSHPPITPPLSVDVPSPPNDMDLTDELLSVASSEKKLEPDLKTQRHRPRYLSENHEEDIISDSVSLSRAASADVITAVARVKNSALNLSDKAIDLSLEMLLRVYLGDSPALLIPLWMKWRDDLHLGSNPLLGSRGAWTGDTLLHWCARMSRINTLRAILSVSLPTLYELEGSEAGWSRAIHLSPRNALGETPLMVAVKHPNAYFERNFLELLKIFEVSIGEVDSEGRTVLHLAVVAWIHDDTTEGRDANCNAWFEGTSSTSTLSNDILSAARLLFDLKSFHPHLEPPKASYPSISLYYVETLVQYLAKNPQISHLIEAVDVNGDTALHCACRAGDKDVMALLAKSGEGRVRFANVNGETPASLMEEARRSKRRRENERSLLDERSILESIGKRVWGKEVDEIHLNEEEDDDLTEDDTKGFRMRADVDQASLFDQDLVHILGALAEPLSSLKHKRQRKIKNYRTALPIHPGQGCASTSSAAVATESLWVSDTMVVDDRM